MPALPLLVFLAFSDQALPAPEHLIQAAIAARQAQTAKGYQFTWREETEQRDLKDHPLKPFRRTYDVIMLEGQNYRKLILVDSQPLDTAMQRKVDRDLEKERELRKKHEFMRQVVPFGGLTELERLFDSKVTGEGVIGGRKAWRIESEPKKAIKTANAQEEEILATRRVTWFDQEDGVELRRHVVYTRHIHNIQPGTLNDIEWGKVGDAWLPVLQHFYGDVSPMPGFHSSGNATTRYSDYKRFSAESTFIPQ
jgi:hypothetical protein